MSNNAAEMARWATATDYRPLIEELRGTDTLQGVTFGTPAVAERVHEALVAANARMLAVPAATATRATLACAAMCVTGNGFDPSAYRWDTTDDECFGNHCANMLRRLKVDGDDLNVWRGAALCRIGKWLLEDATARGECRQESMYARCLFTLDLLEPRFVAADASYDQLRATADDAAHGPMPERSMPLKTELLAMWRNPQLAVAESEQRTAAAFRLYFAVRSAYPELAEVESFRVWTEKYYPVDRDHDHEYATFDEFLADLCTGIVRAAACAAHSATALAAVGHLFGRNGAPAARHCVPVRLLADDLNVRYYMAPAKEDTYVLLAGPPRPPVPKRAEENLTDYRAWSCPIRVERSHLDGIRARIGCGVAPEALDSFRAFVDQVSALGVPAPRPWSELKADVGFEEPLISGVAFPRGVLTPTETLRCADYVNWIVGRMLQVAKLHAQARRIGGRINADDLATAGAPLLAEATATAKELSAAAVPAALAMKCAGARFRQVLRDARDLRASLNEACDFVEVKARAIVRIVNAYEEPKTADAPTVVQMRATRFTGQLRDAVAEYAAKRRALGRLIEQSTPADE